MPFARFDVELRLDKRWQGIADRYRGHAKAVYLDAVLYSAEMLADGRISRAVLLTLCEFDGLRSGRSVIAELTRNGLLDETVKGIYTIVDWERFHSSRADVEAARLAAAERKRRSRGQMSLEMSHTQSHGDDTVRSQRDNGVSARAHTHADSLSSRDKEDLEPESPPQTEQPDQPPPAAADTHPIEAPRPSRIAEVLADLAPGDTDSINHVEPLACQLPADVFEQIVETVKTSRNVRKPVGLLNDLMTNELRKRARTATTMSEGTVVASGIEKIKRDDPRRYLESMANVLDEHAVTAYLNSYIPDEEQRIALLDHWHDARATTAA